MIRNDKNQILMVDEKRGHLTLPGGGWEYGEDLHACLVRELKEEIDLNSSFSGKNYNRTTVL